MFKNRSVQVHDFAMTPRADIPRSSFKIETAHKTTFDAGYLVPIYVDEILPGDSFNLDMTAFVRLATPVFPVMDNLYLDSFFFFVPSRLVWDNFKKFHGEQINPGDPTSFVVPQVTYDPLGAPTSCGAGTIFDYMGLPLDLAAGNTMTVNALPLRAYNLIYNEWFRDENLQNSLVVMKGDATDAFALYRLQRRGKRHDYFTSALPWLQKGQSVPLALGGTAPVIPHPSAATPIFAGTGVFPTTVALSSQSGSTNTIWSGSNTATGNVPLVWSSSGLITDLGAATAATINQIRQSFQIQKILERDARGGTRYTEIVRSHFGVVSPDARLQRPEYLGGGTTPVQFNSVAQTQPDTASPIGRLAAFGTAVAKRHGFSQSFTEHGYIIGLISARADLTYQQGLRKMWRKKTRFEFYYPAMAALGEQAILNEEIYTKGSNQDALVFGYQERWAEYRYFPSMITGKFRSTNATPLDSWHLAQRFTGLPTLASTFIEENPPLSRVLAAGTQADGQQFLADFFFHIRAARPMPMYSVPGLVDHF